ncbi:MAG TPA: helix-turn-helix domain-containing protein [Flavisolibacter sp.]|nr:helix-turn-helix domain-containing protein [Flavisolibacter sp.]
MQIDTSNTLFTLAADLVNHTSKHIFLTGKAGTGKTTFLKYIRQHSPKQMAVVAPTGVAAINAGGVTIHSFFQLPFTPFLPDTEGFSGSSEEVVNRHTLLGRLRITTERRRILQELELLIIDEISMVRCDVLDAIDVVLRHVRSRYQERFGGVQMLFIGDMFQLAPVSKENEWRLLSTYYNSPYFFDSKVMQDDPPVYIEFNKIYRQTEDKFINILNGIRTNTLDEDGHELLQQRYEPAGGASQREGYTILTTHNEIARNINADALKKLDGETFRYDAETEGDFYESAYPADVTLQLKVGAQVMFIKNDTDKSRRYFNGKIGTVTALTKEKIEITCPGEEAIEVKKEKWANIRYSLNNSTRQIEEDELGSFTQYPLRLAWAITIHKSQGLTFQKAIIDVGQAFAPGQVYVALSRCTSLEGLILHSKIRSNSFAVDHRILSFSKRMTSADQLESLYAEAKKAYQQKLLISAFNFSKVFSELKTLQQYLSENKSSFNSETAIWIEKLADHVMQLQSTGEKFGVQLQKLFSLPIRPEENTQLHERTRAATIYFKKEINTAIQLLTTATPVTDSRMHAKEFNEVAKEIFVQLTGSRHLLQGISTSIDPVAFHKHKNKFIVPAFKVNAYAAETDSVKKELAHPALYARLKKLRDEICNKKNLPVYVVLSSKSLEELVTYLPQTLEELENISGFGKKKIEQYGNEFLNIIIDYTSQHQLTSITKEKTPQKKSNQKKPLKQDTKDLSYQMYCDGKTIAEIATERNLTNQTIEGHLAHYIAIGKVSIHDLVTCEKLLIIQPALLENTGTSITPVKEKLGSTITFGEIKFVQAWLEYSKLSEV